ncbi:hypothetical protein FXO38_19458 [Capsicum annuum]|nr:hypothetical protein FXO38_19458 [Capsicum annuum]
MELEQCVANFVRKPTTIAIGMGYVTNSARLPVLIEKGVLIINNSLNRNSIINGARESGATFCVFQHNTAFALHMALRSKIDLMTMDTPDWTYKVQIVDINVLGVVIRCSPEKYAGRTQNGCREITIADDQNTQFLLTLSVEFSEIEGFELQAKVEKEEYPVILGRNIGISSY